MSTDLPTDEQYNAAIERLIAMYAEDSEPFVSVIEVKVSESTVGDAITLRAEGPTDYGFRIHISTHFRAATTKEAA